jgi:hypothetical protein
VPGLQVGEEPPRLLVLPPVQAGQAHPQEEPPGQDLVEGLLGGEAEEVRLKGPGDGLPLPVVGPLHEEGQAEKPPHPHPHRGRHPVVRQHGAHQVRRREEAPPHGGPGGVGQVHRSPLPPPPRGGLPNKVA